jgi:acetyl esterase/lipase
MRKLAPIRLREDEVEDRSVLFDALPWNPTEQGRYLRNVTVPTLTPYLPAESTATGAGVIVAPGGGLHFLTVDNEGAWVAERLVEHGVAAFVLHYRLAPTPDPVPEFADLMRGMLDDPGQLAEVSLVRRFPAAADGAAALALVREHAAGWGIDPDRIGMLGFSAGAYLCLATTLDALRGVRPDFIASIYPVFWGDLVVPHPAPPMFLAWANDDQLGDAVIRSSLTVYDAWRSAGGNVEVHAFASGGHGFGMTAKGTTSDLWFPAFLAWLDASAL